MEWETYLQKLVDETNEVTELSITLDGKKVAFPPIVRASVLMLDKILESKSVYNVFVFPEKEGTVFLFAIMKLLHNISNGHISHSYDPSSFTPGMKLRLGKAVFEFVSFEKDCNGERIKLKFPAENKKDGPLYTTSPIEIVPTLQHADSTKRLTKYSVFADERKKWKASHGVNFSSDIIAELEANKTHMENSVFYMSVLAETKKLFSETRINGKKISDLILVSQANYQGELLHVGSNKMSGIPAFVLSPDLFSIQAAIDNGNPAQSLILDISDSNRILNQLDILDSLMDLKIPILCATDAINSFDLKELTKRGFKIWRWNSESITPSLWGTDDLILSKRVEACAKQNVEYLNAHGNDITEVLSKLSKHRKESEEQSEGFLKLYEKLTRLAFDVLHQIIPFRDIQKDLAAKTLIECSSLLDAEKIYISSKLFSDMSSVIESLKKIFDAGYQLSKVSELSKWLLVHQQQNICVIVANGTNKRLVFDYWHRFGLKNGLHNDVIVYYADEYMKQPLTRFDLTIVTCWLHSTVMRKILHSYKTQAYLVVLYGCETKWQKSNCSRWKREKKQHNNLDIIRQVFSQREPVIVPPEVTDDIEENVSIVDELEDLENTIQSNRIKRYTRDSNNTIGDESVQAYPISFVGNYLGFYRASHKLLSATKVILNDDEKIQAILPKDIREGDFIVIRESSKDIIAELADQALALQGKSELRSIARKWKEVLQLEQIFTNNSDLYEKILKAGSKVTYITFKNWLEDDDMIAPSTEDDIRIIAKACENPMLEEMTSVVYSAAKEVRAAHTQAGVQLSRMLKARIVQELNAYGAIDAFNIWEPIEMEVEGIGKVRILKVIDVEPALSIDKSNTNRLLNE